MTIRSEKWRKANLDKVAFYARRIRLQRKQQLVTEHGGKCIICGFSKSLAALDFHHKDPHTKETGVFRKGWSIDRAREEAIKCVLLCANCHRMVHHDGLEIKNNNE